MAQSILNPIDLGRADSYRPVRSRADARNEVHTERAAPAGQCLMEV
jgi:hypothetical protein